MEQPQGHHRNILARTYGTARLATDFQPGRVAYLTPNEDAAHEYAMIDAEVDAGKPVVLSARITACNPIVLDNIEMQDLHFRHDRVAEYVAAGHDCALGIGNATGTVVFDGSCVEFLSVRELDRNVRHPPCS